MMSTQITQIKLNKKIFNSIYLPYLQENDTRYEIFYGGGGSGKSHFLAQRIIYRSLTSVRKTLVVRKVDRTIRDSVFALLVDMLKKFQIKDMVKINLTNYTIVFPNGSIIVCTGLQDAERIKSIHGITDIWIEEASELTHDEFSQLDIRLRHPSAKHQKMMLSFNPISKQNWVYKTFFENTHPNSTVLKTTYHDNRFLPDSYTASLEALRETNPAYYDIYCLGEFGSLDRLVFTNWEEEEFNYEDIKGKLAVGLDWGFTNDTTALVASIVLDDTIYVFNTKGGTGLVNKDIANLISNEGLNKSTIIADSAEPKSIEELKRLGIIRIKASKKGPDSIVHGIQKLQQYKIVVHPSCEELITELMNYSWQKDKQSGEYINKPVDKFNHYIDALRYSLQCIENPKEIFNINQFGL